MSALGVMENLSATAVLLDQAKKGDQEAAATLMKIFDPILRQWAHGRLPQYMRSLYETADVVQETLLVGFNKIDQFESQYAGSFLVYLRVILANRIKKLISTRPPESELNVTKALEHSTLHHSAHLDSMLAYEEALSKISQDEKEAVVMRVEFGFNFKEIAALLGKPSANAARMYVSRCLLKLAEVMS
ncbi:MAG: RNA polymerase sigma factor [Marinicella sp.]